MKLNDMEAAENAVEPGSSEVRKEQEFLLVEGDELEEDELEEDQLEEGEVTNGLRLHIQGNEGSQGGSDGAMVLTPDSAIETELLSKEHKSTGAENNIGTVGTTKMGDQGSWDSTPKPAGDASDETLRTTAWSSTPSRDQIDGWGATAESSPNKMDDPTAPKPREEKTSSQAVSARSGCGGSDTGTVWAAATTTSSNLNLEPDDDFGGWGTPSNSQSGSGIRSVPNRTTAANGEPLVNARTWGSEAPKTFRADSLLPSLETNCLSSTAQTTSFPTSTFSRHEPSVLKEASTTSMNAVPSSVSVADSIPPAADVVMEDHSITTAASFNRDPTSWLPASVEERDLLIRLGSVRSEIEKLLPIYLDEEAARRQMEKLLGISLGNADSSRRRCRTKIKELKGQLEAILKAVDDVKPGLSSIMLEVVGALPGYVQEMPTIVSKPRQAEVQRPDGITLQQEKLAVSTNSWASTSAALSTGQKVNDQTWGSVAMSDRAQPSTSCWNDNQSPRRRQDSGFTGSGVGDLQSRSSDEHAELFVKSLPYTATEELLQTFISSKFGGLRSVRMPLDRETGKHKGFGFLEFRDRQSAEAVLEAHANGPLSLDGRQLQFNFSQGGAGGRGRGRGRGRDYWSRDFSSRQNSGSTSATGWSAGGGGGDTAPRDSGSSSWGPSSLSRTSVSVQNAQADGGWGPTTATQVKTTDSASSGGWGPSTSLNFVSAPTRSSTANDDGGWGMPAATTKDDGGWGTPAATTKDDGGWGMPTSTSHVGESSGGVQDTGGW
ncbi:hypothetical protein BT69DRAFT_1351457 [Atractiella rhizophila]|nr:hypothetical protein BT69DRAFT_1351457 [Atractiella rhizophila]